MDIIRLNPSERSSPVVVFDRHIYLAGQVGAPGASAAEQTRAILAKIDALLASVGSDKSHLLQAIIWLADIEDFEEMNSVWNQWVVPGKPPARATSEARLAGEEYKVEIVITAAKPSAG